MIEAFSSTNALTPWLHAWLNSIQLRIVSSGGGGGEGEGGEETGEKGRKIPGVGHSLPLLVPRSSAFHSFVFLCRPSLYYPAFRLIGSENHTWRKRYKIQEIFHDCGHAAIWKTRNPTRLWLYTDMKDKKSYTTVDIHRYERRDILQGCGYIEGLCRSLLKVRWYKTIKGAVWL